VDPIVCINVLILFYANGRGSDLQRTLDYIYCVLLNRSYLDGTQYYVGGDAFLYFLTRLLLRSDIVRNRFKPLLKQRVCERIGKDGESLALSMWVLACSVVGVANKVDLWTLSTLQTKSGGWEDGWMYRYGESPHVLISNVGLTTAFAIKAIESMNPRRKEMTPGVIEFDFSTDAVTSAVYGPN
jgi:hypothetical protein